MRFAETGRTIGLVRSSICRYMKCPSDRRGWCRDREGGRRARPRWPRGQPASSRGYAALL